MYKVYFIIGGNLGNRQENLSQAKIEMEKEIGKIINQSSVYETAAWGVLNQSSFYNQTLEVESHLDADEILQKIAVIEKRLGRKRTHKWHARTMDIDILYFGEEIIDEPHLKVPHPQIQNRLFTLIPLKDIAPNFQHPTLKKTTLELIKECPDTLPVNRLVQ